MTGDSSIPTAAEDGHTPVTQKRFAYYKQSLIAEQYLFWIYHGGIFSGEVASV